MLTVNSAAAATTKVLLGLCDCTVDSNVGRSNFSLLPEVVHMCDTRTCDLTCLRTDWTMEARISFNFEILTLNHVSFLSYF